MSVYNISCGGGCVDRLLVDIAAADNISTNIDQALGLEWIRYSYYGVTVDQCVYVEYLVLVRDMAENTGGHEVTGDSIPAKSRHVRPQDAQHLTQEPLHKGGEASSLKIYI